MNALENKIPTPVIGLIAAAGMWGLARVTPGLETAADTRTIAACIGVVGLVFDVAGIASFRLARTTVNPLTPQKTSALVTTGIYRITRNPMYVGMLCLL